MRVNIMARRFVIRLELTEPAKRHLSGLADRHGMTQVAVMSRLVEWFSGQSDLIQAAVLGRYPAEIESDVAKLILRKMAGDS
jgi:hypothetical protein